MMRFILILLSLSFVGCGTLTKPLAEGTASYVNQSLATTPVTETGRTEHFQIDASGCFTNSESATENTIISPAIQSALSKHKAYKAVNVIANRQMGPTITDVITLAFIWGCSYWSVSGDLVY
jgi:hypothetical protein